MKVTRGIFIFTLQLVTVSQPSMGQKAALQSITEKDLKTHIEFLASDELAGRETGEPGLRVAARYLAVQAGRLGLKPSAAARDYFQNYTILERSVDTASSVISIRSGDSLVTSYNDLFFVLPRVKGEGIEIEGSVVFAGYGILEEARGYNDFEGVDIEDKVVMIMSRAPMNEEGTEALIGKDKYMGQMAMRHKLPYLMSLGPRAVLVVLDPKSGYGSVEEYSPGFGSYLNRSKSLKRAEGRKDQAQGHPKTIFINRNVADRLLEGFGTNLREIQLEIDNNLCPHSFELEGTEIAINLRMKQEELEVSNVFGLIEGSDPLLRDEVVIYVAHFDHLGTGSHGRVYNGADDNASGTVALIEIAEAFMKEKKRPARSIGFLWVSAEEIGQFGSKYFADHPLVPTDKIAAAINLDMVGRVRTSEDSKTGRKGITIVGRDTVKVIGGLQSRVLMELNELTLKEMGLTGNYSYNDPDHPEHFYYRSDHINFARKDIPVLFYSTGTHADYHRVTDVVERLDFEKFLKMTRFCYKAGYNVAQYRDPIAVDNPMSGW